MIIELIRSLVRWCIIKIRYGSSFHVRLVDAVHISRKFVRIGDRTLVGQNVLIYDHDHDYHHLDTMRDNFLNSDVIIGNDVWISSNVVILRGSHIGNEAVIGAGTIVKGDIAPGTLVYPRQEYITKKLER